MTAVELLVEKWSTQGTLYSSDIAQAKELERKQHYKIKFKQKYLDELKLRESLLTTSLVNPVHLKMTSDGRGEFPDGYHLTEKGIDLLVETLNL